MIVLQLNDIMLNVIANALGRQPYADVVDTVSEIQRQIAAQAPKPNGGGEQKNEPPQA